MNSPKPRRPRQPSNGRTTSNNISVRDGRTSSGSVSSAKPCRGVLELHPRGYGFLRQISRNLARRDDDIFVSESIVQKYRLRSGAIVKGSSKLIGSNNGPKLVKIENINGVAADLIHGIPFFEELTPTNPKQWLRLENDDQSMSMRVLDLLCPFGIGQRALIASPPRAGKTTLLKQIGRSITNNFPNVHLAALLIDERPEEVTDIRSDIEGEIFASSLDENPSNHARLAKLVLHYCQRMAEAGKDVVLLVDSLTRLARACNKLPTTTGPVGTGGLNIHALELPKKLFAAARAFKEGGSLSIIATVLVETDNRMDEVIFREFKGTGNLDIVLSQQLADRRVWPALDIAQSATRRVELLHDPMTFNATTALRSSLLNLPKVESMKELTTRLEKFSSNGDFVDMIHRSMNSHQ